MSAAKKAYRVEIDKEGCAHCKAGSFWTIVGPDGVGLGQSWGDMDHAQDICDLMNMAFDAGQESTPASETKLTAKAFEYADQCMFMRLEGEGCPIGEVRPPNAWSFSGEDLEEVATLADASDSLKEAFAWLSERGLVTLERDGTGEYAALTEKGMAYAQAQR